MYVRMIRIIICDALRDVVPFVLFKKRKKYPWSNVTFSKVAGQDLQQPCELCN